MQIDLKLRDSDTQLERKILNACKSALIDVFKKSVTPIKYKLRDLCGRLIEGTGEYSSLINGELQGDFGLEDPEARLHEILTVIQKNIEVWYDPITIVGSGLKGGIKAGMIKSGYQDILSLSSSTYISQPSNSQIKWLDWLLLQGDKIAVIGYDIKLDLTPQEKAKSRSKLALMRKGRGWRVPSWAAGYENDNFLLRAFDVPGVELAIADIFETEINWRL